MVQSIRMSNRMFITVAQQNSARLRCSGALLLKLVRLLQRNFATNLFRWITNVEQVQYLLLMSQYLQSTQKSVQTWTTHGLAVKAALSIGLHSRDAMSKFPPIEQEMRKRTWFGCVLLDRCATSNRAPSSVYLHFLLGFHNYRSGLAWLIILT